MNDCCKESDNLKQVGNVSTCNVCGRKHYGINAETGNLGLKIKG